MRPGEVVREALLRQWDLVAAARALPPEVWVDVATGRASAPPGFGTAVPVMT
jgi:hypothetical protein